MFVGKSGNLNTKTIGFVAGVVIIAILLTIFWPWRIVPTGYRGVITQFGKIEGIVGEGLTFVPPTQTLNIFNVRLETTPVEKAQGSTWDEKQGIGIPVDVALTVRYNIQPNKVAEVFEKYSRDGDLSSYVKTATQEAFKAVTARYTAPDLISKRTQVSNDIFAALNAKLNKYGAEVYNIDVSDFQFDSKFMETVRAKATQEQTRMLEENKLLTIQTQQQQKVKVAEAERDATMAKADGDAYSTTKAAEAAANALRLKNAAVRESKDVLELERISVARVQAERWNGQLPVNIYGSAPIPYMNIPNPAAK